jgi:hypothetical protein
VHFTLKLIEQIEPEKGVSCGRARSASRGCQLLAQIEKSFTLVENIVVVAEWSNGSG